MNILPEFQIAAAPVSRFDRDQFCVCAPSGEAAALIAAATASLASRMSHYRDVQMGVEAARGGAL